VESGLGPSTIPIAGHCQHARGPAAAARLLQQLM